jgi:uncharacterized protein (DUF2147 family)
MRPGNLMLLLALATAGVTSAHLASAKDPQVASAKNPQGIWLVDGKAAVQIDDCNGRLCGKLLWLKVPLEVDGAPKRDKKNPDPALRQRMVCGLTLLWNLRSTGPGQWEDGKLYDPASGNTYDVKMELTAADALVARVYQGSSMVSETKALSRVQHGTSEGWC